MKTPDRLGFFIVNFEHISHLFLVFLLLNLNLYILAGLRFNCFIVINIRDVVRSPAKNVRWRALQQLLTALSCELFLQRCLS